MKRFGTGREPFHIGTSRMSMIDHTEPGDKGNNPPREAVVLVIPPLEWLVPAHEVGWFHPRGQVVSSSEIRPVK